MQQHPGEKAVQTRAGVHADAWGSAGVGHRVPPVAADFLAAQRFVVVASTDAAGTLWTTHLTGDPGFLRASGEEAVEIRAALPAVDPLATSLRDGREAGLVAVEAATRRRVRLNGRVEATAEGLLLRTDQVFSNCPKYIQGRTPEPVLDQVTPERVDSDHLTDAQLAWVRAADTFFVGTAAPGQGIDASHRGGNPGFVAARGSRLSWPDYTGNSMYMTLGNLELDPRAAVLFIDWEHGHSLQVTGRATVDWDAARAARTPGAHRHVDLDIERVVEVRHHSPLTWTFQRYSRFNPS